MNLLPEIPEQQQRKLTSREQRDCQIIGEMREGGGGRSISNFSFSERLIRGYFIIVRKNIQACDTCIHKINLKYLGCCSKGYYAHSRQLRPGREIVEEGTKGE